MPHGDYDETNQQPERPIPLRVNYHPAMSPRVIRGRGHLAESAKRSTDRELSLGH
jgi:hypothetical protein